MRIERDDGVGGRTFFREYFIDMERIDTSLLCVAHVDDVSFQISRKRQIFCFGIAYDHPCVVRPFVQNKAFQKERLTRTRLTDDHGVGVLIQVPPFP